MARIGVSMMFQSKAKFAGTLFGVIFATILVNQQLGSLFGLINKNTMFLDHTACDLWITPKGTSEIVGGGRIPISALNTARSQAGVAWAEPLVIGGGAIRRPDGKDEPITLIGTRLPRLAGGPWNMVAGDPREELVRPFSLIFEDSQRSELGGLNLGSETEFNGHRVFAGGFSWGLLPFGPSYAFASYGDATTLLGVPSSETGNILIGINDGVDAEAIAAELQNRLPDLEVRTSERFQRDIVWHLLLSTPIGLTFGISALFGLIVGLVIVGLSMFSAVVDNIREFGTLKAVGARNSDLTVLLLSQALMYALIGSVVGLFAVTQIALAMRTPSLALNIFPGLVIGTVIGVILLCLFASLLALLRVRNVEPGIVFR